MLEAQFELSCVAWENFLQERTKQTNLTFYYSISLFLLSLSVSPALVWSFGHCKFASRGMEDKNVPNTQQLVN